MLSNILQMAWMTLLPPIVSAALYLLDKKTPFGRSKRALKQIIIGIIFGGIAILGTESGVSVAGATMNVRDAAPLCAGLFFGAPAGIIAGVIGGVERWFAVLWGAGSYTRLACTIGTVFAGLFGAALRKWLFEDKRPSWYYSLSTGVIAEVFHLLLVFITNMSDVTAAFEAVRSCAIPMLVCNGAAVMLSSMALCALEHPHAKSGGHRRISQLFQRWLLICVAIAFLVTNGFIFILQTNLSNGSVHALLSLYIEDVQADIRDASDENLLVLSHSIADELDAISAPDTSALAALKQKYDVSEISIIDGSGIITLSTTAGYDGYDMSGGEQSQEFLVLLGGTGEYVQEYRPISHDASVSMKYAGITLSSGGFVQVGYDAARFQKDIGEQAAGIARNRHVGQSGYIILTDASGSVISGTERIDTSQLTEADLTGSTVYGEVVNRQLAGEDCCCMYAVTEGYRIMAAIPVHEALFDRNISVYVTAFMEALIFAVLFILIYLLIKRLVVDNLRKVNGALMQITEGDLDVSVDVRTNEEFSALSDDINSTVLTLKSYIAKEAARIDQELEFAKVIQASTLPSVFPPFPERSEFDIYAQMTPAREVGGDFYDFYMLPGDRLAFLIADVSGKGISAAMFMMTAKTLIKGIAQKETDAAAILTQANTELCKNNEAEMFVTCWMGILDIGSGIVSFANAGHNPPLIRRGGGSYEYFKTRPGFVLGGMEGIKYRSGELALLPGDAIFLYTDGVTEATDKGSALYGDGRLNSVLNSAQVSGAKELCSAVKSDVDAFVCGAPQFDDITMLCIQINEQGSICLHPDRASIPQAAAYVEGVLEEAGVPAKTAAKVNIALDEIYSNVVQYSGADRALICCRAQNGQIRLIIADDGAPYDPLAAPEPDTSLCADDRDIGGLGIFMVKKSMDSMSYRFLNGRNILMATKAF